MKTVLDEWSEYFKNSEVTPEQKDQYLHYISNLLENNCPIIFESKHLAKLIGIDHKTLSGILCSRWSFYREFSIPKRMGGRRYIRSPYPKLAYCQQWIYKNILSKISVHDSCHSYIHARGIKTNAQVHVTNPVLLKIDIVDFFGSISQLKVKNFFKSLGYSELLSYQLASLCTVNNSLPQGAPSSPYLSNLIAKPLDIALNELARSESLAYSRYADDIVFSGSKICRDFIERVKAILSSDGFEINTKKTLLTSKSKRIITGLSVGSGRVMVPRHYKRKFRQEVHYLLKNGLESTYSAAAHVQPLHIEHLLGKAHYILSIEPENKFVSKNLPNLKLLRDSLDV